MENSFRDTPDSVNRKAWACNLHFEQAPQVVLIQGPQTTGMNDWRRGGHLADESRLRLTGCRLLFSPALESTGKSHHRQGESLPTCPGVYVPEILLNAWQLLAPKPNRKD